MSHTVQAEHLGKRFKALEALKDVSFALEPGSSIGLVGRNGSGKTTLLRLIAGLSIPSAGTCRTLGRDCRKLGAEHLGRMGYVDQDAELLPWLKVRQHIDYVAALQPRWDRDLARRLEQALELPMEQAVGELSPGTRRRLAIFLAVAHRPALLLLDEPFAGIDPIQRKLLAEVLLERQVEDGATLLTSSHQLSDLERSADRLLCLDGGRLTVNAEIDTLKEQFAEWRVSSAQRQSLPVFSEPFIIKQTAQGGQALLTVRCDPADLGVFRSTHGVAVEARPMDLEQIFPLLVEHTEEVRS